MSEDAKAGPEKAPSRVRFWIVFGTMVVLAYAYAISVIFAPAEERVNRSLDSYELDAGFKAMLQTKVSEAEQSDRAVLLYYSMVGCSPCRALQDNVFASEEWKAFAKKKLVFRKHIFPLFTDKPSPEQMPDLQFFMQLDEELAYPLLAVVSAEGVVTSLMSGYGGENADYYIDWVKRNGW
ncbi:MAG: hypothetical protein CMO80_09180 [Verrucomicrobiales bacterium]|nr:hypothetical protein [Verrucomicrobiales bacterium]|tara:strand:- start:3496 stop:4035 length:540 start_codon:yes stop_codon:yes gene_type:complete